MSAPVRAPIPPDPRLARRQAQRDASTSKCLNLIGFQPDRIVMPRPHAEISTPCKFGEVATEVLKGDCSSVQHQEGTPRMADGTGPQQPAVFCGFCRELIGRGLRPVRDCQACADERAFRAEIDGVPYYGDLEGADDALVATVRDDFCASGNPWIVPAVDLDDQGGVEVIDERFVREFQDAAAKGSFDPRDDDDGDQTSMEDYLDELDAARRGAR